MHSKERRSRIVVPLYNKLLLSTTSFLLHEMIDELLMMMIHY